MRYAIVENGIVSNIVIWDGENNIFADFVTVEITDEMAVAIGHSYTGGDFYPPPAPEKSKEELISEAGQTKMSLLSNADSVTDYWRTELALGIIDDTDKAKLTVWMKYIKAVKAVNTSTVPDVNWPERPAE